MASIATCGSDAAFLTGGGKMGALMRAHDWSASPLGDPATWPQSLRSVVGLLLNSKFPMFVAWGEELGFLYNDTYAEILGAKHPHALGRRFHDVWSEIWSDISPLIDCAMAGDATYRENLPLLMNRKGYDEQTWFTFSYSPVRDESGAVAGMFCFCTETTQRVLAEPALRTSQEQFELLLNKAPLGVYLVDGDFVIRQVNPIALPVFGDITGGPVGRDFDEVIHILWDKGYADELVRIFRHTLETGEPYVTPERAEYRGDRNVIEYYEWRLDRISVSGGHYAVVCYFRDISAQVETRKQIEEARESARQSEERQAFLLRFSDALRAQPNDDAVVDLATRMLADELGLDRCYAAAMYPAGDRIDVIQEFRRPDLTPMPTPLHFSDFPEAGKQAVDRTLIFNDTANDPALTDTDKRSLAAMSFGAFLSPPLRQGAGTPIWALGAVSSQPRHWTPGEVALVEEAAERTWAAVERARAEAARNESEEKFRALFDNMAEGLVLFGVVRGPGGETIDLIYRDANKALEHQAGFDRAKIIGQPFTHIVTPADAERWTSIFAPAIALGESVTVEEYSETVDRWFSVSVYPNGQDEIAVFYRDISERKRAEAALREGEERQAFLLRLSDALRPLGDAVDVQGEATRLLGEQLGADRCYYFEAEPERSRYVIHRDYRRGERMSLAATYPLEDWPDLTVAFQHDGPVVIPDTGVTDVVEDGERERVEARDIHALLIVPLVKQGRFVAALAAAQAEPRAWTSEEVALVEDVAERTWAAVERARAEAAFRESEARYQALFAASPVPFMVLSPNAPDFTITAANDAYFAATSTTRESLVGRRLFDVFPDDPSRPGQLGSEALAISLDHVLTTRTTDAMERVRYDLSIPGGGFEPHWWEAINAPMLDASGEVSAIIHQVTRVTELHYGEEAELEEQDHQAFLLKLSDALRAESSSDAIADRALRMLFEHMRLDRCYVGIYRLAEGIADFPQQMHDDRLSPLPAQVRLSDFPEALRAAFDRTLVIDDVVEMDGLSDIDRASFDGLGLRALIAATLRKGENNPLWAIVAASTCHRVWTQGEIALVEEVAERIWTAVERARAETSLRESEDRYHTLFESLDQGFCVFEMLFDGEGRPVDYVFVEVNPAFEAQTGLVSAVGRRISELAPGHEQRWYNLYGEVALTGTPLRVEDVAQALGRWYEIYAYRVGEPEQRRVAALFNDVSERKRDEARIREMNETLEQRVEERTAELTQAQEALRQSQKLEAMGQLTGGVAHDFNNLLTPIIGGLDMLMRRGVGSERERERRLIDGALQSAERAKILVQRLLAFARRQPLQPVAVEISKLVEGMVGMIGSTLGPTIDVRVVIDPDLPPAKADPNQLEMALLNLAVNARDAMPDGGELNIKARRESVRPGHASGLQPGDYVLLCVVDTGAGMDEATRQRAIEPFFSTKGVGQGTGLGLSMVHGLVAQLGGGLTIDSAPGRGTTIELWLPISTAAIGVEGASTAVPATRVGRGVVLLVDDEELVRLSTADMLMDLGFEVVEAGTAEEALQRLKTGTMPNLLITDHLMPGMNGVDLAREARAIEPTLPILIVSGYAEVDGVAQDLPRLTKPFRIAELAETISALIPVDG